MTLVIFPSPSVGELDFAWLSFIRKVQQSEGTEVWSVCKGVMIIIVLALLSDLLDHELCCRQHPFCLLLPLLNFII